MSRLAPPTPTFRTLKVFTIDPSTQVRMQSAAINETVLLVPWEESLGPGPSGEYLEIIDYDPASECFYAPVDLNDPYILATDGYAPSEGNPQFHQQMVYAVIMTTISNFEKALGRKALWGRRNWGEGRDNRPVLRLRVYPHALREPNAYYSPEKKALLFGYFPAMLNGADGESPEERPGGLVFTCLSQDVIAHETTHALLDGLHRYYALDTNEDSLAFHEAFADIVALFQHFSQAQALRHVLAESSGDLGKSSLLSDLAVQFGQAIGKRGGLRSAIDRAPSASAYEAAIEPHERGSVLVAAMFDAFRAIYERRTTDLIEIATGGRGVLPPGKLLPALVERLACEASRTAAHILRMAIRALDYAPPVDLTFGDYLRALISGDIDVMPDDTMHYRVALVEAFRRRGIYPNDVLAVAPDALRWLNPAREIKPIGGVDADDFRGLLMAFTELSRSQHNNRVDDWRASVDRAQISEASDGLQARARDWLKARFGKIRRRDPHEELVGYWAGERTMAAALGLAFTPDAPRSIYRGEPGGEPSFQVHSVRYALRPRPDGNVIRDVVIEVIQRRRGYLDPRVQREVDELDRDLPHDDEKVPARYVPDFTFRGGCTLLVDGETGRLRFAICKDILSQERLHARRTYEQGGGADLGFGFASPPRRDHREPFAMLHRAL